MAIRLVASGGAYLAATINADLTQDVALSFWLADEGLTTARAVFSFRNSAGSSNRIIARFQTATTIRIEPIWSTTNPLYDIDISPSTTFQYRHIYLLLSNGVPVFYAHNGQRRSITTFREGVGAPVSTTAERFYLGDESSGPGCSYARLALWTAKTGSILNNRQVIKRLASGESPAAIVGKKPDVFLAERRTFEYANADVGYGKVLDTEPLQLLVKPAVQRYPVLVYSADGPVISGLGTKLEAGQALVINGGGFGTETGDAAVTISPANDIADAGAVVQTPTAWADGQITVDSPTLTGMSDGDTVYVFVTDSAGTDSTGQSVQIADMVLRVGPPVATDDILDTDTGDPIASESLVKVAVMTTNLETVVAAYTDAVITAGKFEYNDSSIANISTEDDEFVVVMDGGTSRLGALRATVVDRNED